MFPAGPVHTVGEDTDDVALMLAALSEPAHHVWLLSLNPLGLPGIWRSPSHDATVPVAMAKQMCHSLWHICAREGLEGHPGCQWSPIGLRV